MQQAVWSVNGDLPLATVETMQNLYSQSLARTSFTLVMLLLRVPCTGAGHHRHLRVISYTVSQRTRRSVFAWRWARRRASSSGCSSAPRCCSQQSASPSAWAQQPLDAVHEVTAVWHQSARPRHLPSRSRWCWRRAQHARAIFPPAAQPR